MAYANKILHSELLNIQTEKSHFFITWQTYAINSNI